MAALEQIVGNVSKVNENGIQISERPGAWLNVSQYADPRPDMPEVGQRVRLGLDGKQFIRTVAVLESANHEQKPASGDVQPGASAPPSQSAAPSARDVVGTRLACLAAAASFLALRPEAKSTDVIAMAERLEAWILRGAS